MTTANVLEIAETIRKLSESIESLLAQGTTHELILLLEEKIKKYLEMI